MFNVQVCLESMIMWFNSASPQNDGAKTNHVDDWAKVFERMNLRISLQVNIIGSQGLKGIREILWDWGDQSDYLDKHAR